MNISSHLQLATDVTLVSYSCKCITPKPFIIAFILSLWVIRSLLALVLILVLTPIGLFLAGLAQASTFSWQIDCSMALVWDGLVLMCRVVWMTTRAAKS